MNRAKKIGTPLPIQFNKIGENKTPTSAPFGFSKHEVIRLSIFNFTRRRIIGFNLQVRRQLVNIMFSVKSIGEYCT